jgi:hypothetical protein
LRSGRENDPLPVHDDIAAKPAWHAEILRIGLRIPASRLERIAAEVKRIEEEYVEQAALAIVLPQR